MVAERGRDEWKLASGLHGRHRGGIADDRLRQREPAGAVHDGVLHVRRACLAALQDVAADDRRQVAPKTVTADGGTQEVSLDTRGVEHTGPKAGRYDATLWWHNGIPRTDGSQVEISHNYRHLLRECDGRVLRTTGEDGYTMSTFAPAIPSATPR